ncbi:MAG: DUF2804 domain-containing protein, partial [Candidatus Enteromonas sp.]
MEQHRLSKGPLLGLDGNLLEAGYATDLVKDYDRSAILGLKSRIKEWDYYYIGNKRFGIALTIADNSYMAMASISVLTYEGIPSSITKSPMKWFTFGKTNLPSSSKEGDVRLEGKGYRLSFVLEGKKRRLQAEMKDFGRKGDTFHCDIVLTPTMDDTMVIATPFHKKGHFYYNQKMNCLKAVGYARLGEKTFDLGEDTYAVLDWGRGVWTYKNTWYWASLSAELDDKPFGFNLGYGFGDTSKATENMVFFEGKAHKLDDVRMDIPIAANGGDDYMAPWKFRSSSGDIDMDFVPVYRRHCDTNALLIRSNQNQVFGLYSGKIVLEGKEIAFQDLPGFA